MGERTPQRGRRVADEPLFLLLYVPLGAWAIIGCRYPRYSPERTPNSGGLCGSCCYTHRTPDHARPEQDPQPAPRIAAHTLPLTCLTELQTNTHNPPKAESIALNGPWCLSLAAGDPERGPGAQVDHIAVAQRYGFAGRDFVAVDQGAVR